MAAVTEFIQQWWTCGAAAGAFLIFAGLVLIDIVIRTRGK